MTASTFGVDSQRTAPAIGVTDATIAEYTKSSHGHTWKPDTDVCARCGRDETGNTWPDCVTASQNAHNTGHNIPADQMHQLTCARYWTSDDMWLCSSCETELQEMS